MIAEIHEAGGVLAFGHIASDEEIEGFTDEAVDLELAVVGGELEETEVGEARVHGFGDTGGAVFQQVEFDVRIFRAVFLNDGWEPAADEEGMAERVRRPRLSSLTSLMALRVWRAISRIMLARWLRSSPAGVRRMRGRSRMMSLVSSSSSSFLI